MKVNQLVKLITHQKALRLIHDMKFLKHCSTIRCLFFAFDQGGFLQYSFFSEVVRQKYPLTPCLAFKKAKRAANQAGLERRNVLSRSQGADAVTTPENTQ